LADGLIPPLPAWTPTPRQERQLMVEAAGRFLANVAGTAGVLLVLDDLQWAGGDDLALLATLLHGSEAPRLRVAGAYRDTEVGLDSPLAVALADLTAAGLAARRHLGPLTLPEASALLDDLLASEDTMDTSERPGEPLRARVLRRANGVPFYLLSYAHALHAATEEADTAVPWDITQSIRQRVAGLPREGRAVLGTAAVIGRVVAPWLLMDAALLTEREALEGLDAACDAHLLVEEGDDAYVFAHDVIRDIVETDVGAARRAVLHRQVGEALERRSETTAVEALAYHYGRSDHVDKAILYLERAGDHAHEQHALIAADGYYRDAVRRLDERGRAGESAHVRAKHGAVLATQARYDAALEALDSATAAYRAAGDLERLARVTAQVGRVHAQRGTPEEGRTAIHAVLARLPTHRSPGVAALYLALAHLPSRGQRAWQEQLAASERAAYLARALGDQRLLADAEDRRGDALWGLGRIEHALAALSEAMALAEQVSDLDCFYRATNHTHGFLIMAGKPGEAAPTSRARSPSRSRSGIRLTWPGR